MSEPSLLPLVISLAIISPIVIFRMRKMQKGTKVSVVKTIGFSAFLLGFSIFAVLSSFSVGVPLGYSAMYTAIFGVVAFGSYHYANRVLDFWKTRDGSIYVKGGMVLLVFYVAALVTRIAISSAFGGESFEFQESNTNASPASILAAIILDALLVAGAGLLVGRNARIMRRFQAISSGKERPRQME
jgi:hypothetical protein